MLFTLIFSLLFISFHLFSVHSLVSLGSSPSSPSIFLFGFFSLRLHDHLGALDLILTSLTLNVLLVWSPLDFFIGVVFALIFFLMWCYPDFYLHLLQFSNGNSYQRYFSASSPVLLYYRYYLLLFTALSSLHCLFFPCLFLALSSPALDFLIPPPLLFFSPL